MVIPNIGVVWWMIKIHLIHLTFYKRRTIEYKTLGSERQKNVVTNQLDINCSCKLTYCIFAPLNFNTEFFLSLDNEDKMSSKRR